MYFRPGDFGIESESLRRRGERERERDGGHGSVLMLLSRLESDGYFLAM